MRSAVSDGKAIPQFTQNNAHQSVKLSSIADIVSRRVSCHLLLALAPTKRVSTLLTG